MYVYDVQRCRPRMMNHEVLCNLSQQHQYLQVHSEFWWTLILFITASTELSLSLGFAIEPGPNYRQGLPRPSSCGDVKRRMDQPLQLLKMTSPEGKYIN